MKRFSHVKQRQFTSKLAALPPSLRYLTAKHRWYAARLGLYETVIDNQKALWVYSKRAKVVNAFANIKMQRLSDEEAKACIHHILSQNKFRRYHMEFIKEVVFYYPVEILHYLESNLRLLSDSYYHGLYLALISRNYSSIGDVKDSLQYYLDKSVVEYTGGKCLYNNNFLDHKLDKLSNLNDIFSYHNIDTIELLNEHASFTVINLKAARHTVRQQELINNNRKHKVTVIVTAYNTSKTINSCINSLLQQTWRNLEIIVVDDASSDDTLLNLQHLSAQNTAIKVIALPKNVGTFAAKSIGAQYATGEFLTCQDSDDWAHPQKIAEQVQPLIEDASIIATTSHWLRLDYDGKYYVRQIYPFMRQNPASPMFRLQTVKQETGLWHIVRTGADSEFFERLKLVYGNERITVIKKPLTIASHRHNSLMTSEQFGIYNREAALARLNYWEAWRLWHIDILYQKSRLVMPDLQQQANSKQALFPGIPYNIQVDMLSLKENLATHEVLSKL